MKSVIIFLACFELILQAHGGPVKSEAKPEFQKLGQWKDPTNRANVITYYLDETPTTQYAAWNDCVEFYGGSLLTILNKPQLDVVRVFLSQKQVSGDFWTAGAFNEDTSKWYWLTNQDDIMSAILFWYGGYPSTCRAGTALALRVSPNFISAGYVNDYNETQKF